MIYTLTLNPAIDVFITIDNFKLGVTNIAQEQAKTLGGKGINCAIMSSHLGQEVMALGFMGLENSQQFNNYLINEKVTPNFTIVSGEVRSNIKVKSTSNKQETELNCCGFTVAKNEERKLMELIKTTVKYTDLLMIAGSMARGCSENFYRDVAQYCFTNKIPFAIDATNHSLLSTLKYAPLLIKPNLSELNEIFNSSVNFDNIKEVIALGKKLIKQGAQNVLISNGAEGSLLVTKTASYLANSVKGTLVSSVGAGDSMFAAFVVNYWKHNDYETALKLAAAAGASTAFSFGIADKNLVEKNQKLIVLKKY